MPKRRPWVEPERILAALDRDGVGMTYSDIFQATGISHTRLQGEINKLESRGLIMSIYDGYPSPILYWKS
jgi:DNA-binding transcriptional ArsR family regulator